MSADVYVVDGKRTPFGSFGGSLSDVDSTTLGATAIKGLLAGVSIDPAAVSEVIIGQVL
jgi:acetyl-CoA C-acetyltransferase